MEGEKIINNQRPEKMYEYPVVCSDCGKTFEIKKTTDSRMEGKPSHSFCRECARKACIENARERLCGDFEEEK